jgi:hypothetical protein
MRRAAEQLAGGQVRLLDGAVQVGDEIAGRGRLEQVLGAAPFGLEGVPGRLQLLVLAEEFFFRQPQLIQGALELLEGAARQGGRLRRVAARLPLQPRHLFAHEVDLPGQWVWGHASPLSGMGSFGMADFLAAGKDRRGRRQHRRHPATTVHRSGRYGATRTHLPKPGNGQEAAAKTVRVVQASLSRAGFLSSERSDRGGRREGKVMKRHFRQNAQGALGEPAEPPGDGEREQGGSVPRWKSDWWVGSGACVIIGSLGGCMAGDLLFGGPWGGPVGLLAGVVLGVLAAAFPLRWYSLRRRDSPEGRRPWQKDADYLRTLLRVAALSFAGGVGIVAAYIGYQWRGWPGALLGLLAGAAAGGLVGVLMALEAYFNVPDTPQGVVLVILFAVWRWLTGSRRRDAGKGPPPGQEGEP